MQNKVWVGCQLAAKSMMHPSLLEKRPMQAEFSMLSCHVEVELFSSNDLKPQIAHSCSCKSLSVTIAAQAQIMQRSKGYPLHKLFLSTPKPNEIKGITAMKFLNVFHIRIKIKIFSLSTSET